MGVFSEYLNRKMGPDELLNERKAQLRRISQIRSRDILVYAADLSKASQADISMEYADLRMFKDQLDNLAGDALDLVIETPGGQGEVAEDIVRMIRDKYDDFAVIVPGWCKSAGTLVAMAADDILMESSSALGPIDAQISLRGNVFSADALLEGFERIKAEVANTGELNMAYYPTLETITPGDLQAAHNAQEFARCLVRQWLASCKFRQWATHSSTGEPVTDEERMQRADEIAAALANQGEWLTHGRSLHISDLERLRLVITDYGSQPDLADAIRRYHTLVQITFMSNVYKIIETTDAQVYRHHREAPTQQGLLPMLGQGQAGKVHIDLKCGKCQNSIKVQANVGQPQPLDDGCVPMPADGLLKCSACGEVIDLRGVREDIEGQAGLPIVGTQETPDES